MDPATGQRVDDYTYDTASAYQTESSTAYTLQAVLQYPGVLSGWDLSVPLNFSHVVDGNTPLKGAISAGQEIVGCQLAPRSNISAILNSMPPTSLIWETQIL